MDLYSTDDGSDDSYKFGKFKVNIPKNYTLKMDAPEG
jgi:hypothetical protein